MESKTNEYAMHFPKKKKKKKTVCLEKQSKWSRHKVNKLKSSVIFSQNWEGDALKLALKSSNMDTKRLANPFFLFSF